MLTRRLAALGAAALVAATPLLASAAWSTAGTASAIGKADTAPVATQAAPSVSVTGSTVSINFAAVSTIAAGAPASSYTIRRYAAAAGGTATGSFACTRNVSAPNCTDAPGAGTTTYYTYTPVWGTNWNGVESARSTSAVVAAPADTTGPLVTATCPTTGGAYTLKSGPTNGTWITACGEKVNITASDSTGVASVKISVRAGTTSGQYLSGNGGNFNSSTEVQIPATLSAGVWSINLADNKLVAGTHSIKVYATDTVTPSANLSTTAYTFSVS